MNKKTNHSKLHSNVDKMTFEQALSELEDLLSSMEKGSLTLDESLVTYRKGILLVHRCQSELNRVEKAFGELSQSIDSQDQEEQDSRLSDHSES